MSTEDQPTQVPVELAVPEATAPVEVDDRSNSDADSSLGQDDLSTTESITSSILNYRHENGRTYHAYKEGSYLYPNDEEESDRLDLQHHLWGLTLDGKLGNAPPAEKGASPARVLDIGTGTGIWSMDFGDEHPDSHVIGTDLSPIQPKVVPPNVEFQIDDAEAEWVFSEPFDYIHSRVMNSAIGDWPALIKRCYKNMKPGGWLELHEFGPLVSDDGTLKDTYLAQVVDVMNRGAVANNRPFINVFTDLRPWMEDAGFVSITENHHVWPSNPWPKDAKLKELARWTNISMRAGLEWFMMAGATRFLGWQPEEVMVLAAKGKQDANNRGIHAYLPINVIYGQKPEEKPEP